VSFEGRLEEARARDAADPLAGLRERFVLPRGPRGDPLVYLAGHSLGPLPRAAEQLIAQELEDWGGLAVLGHERARRPWVRYHEFLNDELERLAGARAGEIVAMNSLTVNLHLMLASFYRPSGRRTKILIESGAFPSDRHAVVSQIAWHGHDAASELLELAPQDGSDLVTESAIEATLERRGAEIAVMLWPGVQYLTGQAFDLTRIARAARRAGCIVGFDLAHAIGNLPLALHAADADFAVWCSYKYLNGGPGAIGGCFVHERHAAHGALPRLAGWWGHEPATRFRMRPEHRPSPGAEGWQVSNPPILSSAPLIASLEIFRAAGMERLRAKSVALTGYLEELLAALPVTLLTPRDRTARGAQLSLRIATAAAPQVLARLEAQGVVCDFREPDVLRVAPAPLYNRFEDVTLFACALERALGERR